MLVFVLSILLFVSLLLLKTTTLCSLTVMPITMNTSISLATSSMLVVFLTYSLKFLRLKKQMILSVFVKHSRRWRLTRSSWQCKKMLRLEQLVQISTPMSFLMRMVGLYLHLLANKMVRTYGIRRPIRLFQLVKELSWWWPMRMLLRSGLHLTRTLAPRVLTFVRLLQAIRLLWRLPRRLLISLVRTKM